MPCSACGGGGSSGGSDDGSSRWFVVVMLPVKNFDYKLTLLLWHRCDSTMQCVLYKTVLSLGYQAGYISLSTRLLYITNDYISIRFLCSST